MLIFFTTGVLACKEKHNAASNTPEAMRAELIAVDKAFSQQSQDSGMKAAFINRLDSNAVLLRPGHMPITGADALDYYLMTDDAGYTMNWQPLQADVAASGDLGYTYGIYAIHSKTIDTSIYGTYINVWKKQANGEWKLAAETANEGIDEAQSF